MEQKISNNRLTSAGRWKVKMAQLSYGYAGWQTVLRVATVSSCLRCMILFLYWLSWLSQFYFYNGSAKFQVRRPPKSAECRYTLLTPQGLTICFSWEHNNVRENCWVSLHTCHYTLLTLQVHDVFFTFVSIILLFLFWYFLGLLLLFVTAGSA